METVYSLDLKLKIDDIQLKHIFKMDISCLNILAFSSTYLSVSNQYRCNPHMISS